MITAGIDCGTSYTKALVLEDDRVLARKAVRSGPIPKEAAKECLRSALEEAWVSYEDLDALGLIGESSLGLGETLVSASKALSLACRRFVPGLILDLGAQKCRAVKADEKGGILETAQNEDCAAAGGMFLELMAERLGIALEKVDELSRRGSGDIPLNAQCLVFAEAEAVSLIAGGARKEDICRAVMEALARRCSAFVRQLGIQESVVLTGGLALNSCFEEELRNQIKPLRLITPEYPIFVLCLGAAIACRESSRAPLLGAE